MQISDKHFDKHKYFSFFKSRQNFLFLGASSMKKILN
jgi:hypothetical protein